MPAYTDYLGNPIDVGDAIVYPTCTGSSAADLNMGIVTAIEPIIPDNPTDPQDRTGRLAKDGHHALPRLIPGRWVRSSDDKYGDFYRDDSKAYVLTVRRIREGSTGRRIYSPDRSVRLKNVDRVVVVSSLTDQREPIL